MPKKGSLALTHLILTYIFDKPISKERFIKYLTETEGRIIPSDAKIFGYEEGVKEEVTHWFYEA